MASKTEICNMALTHLGIQKRIADIETERSTESLACRIIYETAKDTVLRSYRWPFTRKFRTLALVEEDPTTEWAFSYRRPSDCLMMRRILSGTRTDTRDTRVPFIEGQDDDGLLIYTDKESAEVEFTARSDDPSKYPPDFILAFSMLIAHLIAPSLTGGDPFKMGDRALGLYTNMIATARSMAATEEQEDIEPESEFIRVRDT